MYSPIPPFCRFTCAHQIFEDSLCCRTCGSCGFHKCLSWRERVMIFASVLSFIGIIFQLPPVIGITENVNIIKKTAWALGDVKENIVYPPAFLDSLNATLPEVNWGNAEKVFISLKGFVLCSSSSCEFIDWGNDCLELTLCEEAQDYFPAGTFENDCGQYCSDCDSANAAAEKVAIIGFITAFPQLFTDIQRSTWKGDLNCQKVMGIVTGLFGFFSTLAALSAYNEACGRKLPTEMGTLELEWRVASSWILIFFAIIMKPIDAIIHCSVPTPVYKRQEGYDGWAPPPENEYDWVKRMPDTADRVEGDCGVEIMTADDGSDL